MKEEKEVKNVVLECMKNICSYYNKDIELIEKFKNFEQEN